MLLISFLPQRKKKSQNNMKDQYISERLHIVKGYAHDYRHMAMTEVELNKMLLSFLNEIDQIEKTNI